MKHISKILTLLAIVVLAACSPDHNDSPNRPDLPELPDRPGAGHDESVDDALLDATMRIESPMLTLRYDSGGVLFSRADDGSVSAVRLSDDVRFEFDPTDKTLSINGVAVALRSCQLAKSEGTVQWYRLTTADPSTDNKIYIVVDL